MSLIKLIRIVIAGVLLAATASLGWAGPSAAAPKNDQISGVGTFDNNVDCTEIDDLFTIKMTGSLEGCWYTTAFDVVQETKSGIYQERGTETFIGCLVENGEDVACGSFDTTYKFTGKFAVDFSEIHGRCQHPIASGDGDFSGSTGRVDFKDDVVTGEYNYRGHIKLG